jgi:hypothetical protein
MGYKVDNSYKEIQNMAMAILLVRLPLTNGLSDYVTIIKGPSIYYQPLDYEGIPFNGRRYHVYRHLANKCPLPNK